MAPRVRSLLFVFISLAFANPINAQSPRLAISYVGLAGNQGPLWVAKELGLFGKHGLDVDLVAMMSGSLAITAVVSGDAPIGHVGGTPAINAALAGADTVLIAGTEKTIYYQLVVPPTVVSAKDLKGKRVGVSRFGSFSDFVMRVGLERLGLNPGVDVTILQTGSTQNRLSLLKSGAISGTVIFPPETVAARKAGTRTLLDYLNLNLEVQGSGITTSRRFLKEHKDVAVRFLRGFLEGIAAFKSRRDDSLRVMNKYLRIDDQEILEEAYDYFANKIIPQKPYPTLKGIEFVLRFLSEQDPRARKAKPEQFADLSLLKEIDNSGFIDRLYK